jgi:hypothetical protein
MVERDIVYEVSNKAFYHAWLAFHQGFLLLIEQQLAVQETEEVSCVLCVCVCVCVCEYV